MEPIKIRIRRVVDFGEITSFVGTEVGTEKSVVIHIDYQPVSALWNVWRATREQPMEFKAESVTLNLEFDCDDEGDGERLSVPAHLRGQRA